MKEEKTRIKGLAERIAEKSASKALKKGKNKQKSAEKTKEHVTNLMNDLKGDDVENPITVFLGNEDSKSFSRIERNENKKDKTQTLEQSSPEREIEDESEKVQVINFI